MSAVFGLLLQVKGPDELLDAAKVASVRNLSPMDAFTPFPMEDLPNAMGKPESRVPWVMLACGISGAVLAFGTMTFAAVVHYPFNVGGRPYFSWPAFIPIAFELMVLFASLGGAFALVILARLPRFHHPIFNDERFRDAEQGGFFLLLPNTPEAREFLETFYTYAWKEVPV